MPGKQTETAHTGETVLGRDIKDILLYRRASLHFWSKSFAILSIFCFSSVLIAITLASCCCRWVSISSFKFRHHKLNAKSLQAKHVITKKTHNIILIKQHTGVLHALDRCFVNIAYTFYPCNLYLDVSLCCKSG